jgi:hypothetical protein
MILKFEDLRCVSSEPKLYEHIRLNFQIYLIIFLILEQNQNEK